MNGRLRQAAAGAAGIIFLILTWINAAPTGSHDGRVQLPPGSTVGQLVERLVAEGQLRSPRWFRLLLRGTGTDRRLKAGVYPIRKGTGAWGLVRVLSRGRGVTVRVTVPEGWTADRIATRLEESGVCAREAFLRAVSSTTAEGFLFPDTYELDPYISADRVCDVMRLRFDQAWRQALSESTASLKEVSLSTAGAASDRVRLADGRWWTARQVVALASIVERESGHPAELPVVAAVYHNRLKKRMRLEADPTVQYALGQWKERLLYRDLEVDSPYNTYKHFGLPPGPIGNPGLGALKAVLAPAPVPFLYFVADPAGEGHLFSVSYGEHLRNVNAYRQGRKKGR